MEEIKIFIEKLKEEKLIISQKLRFLNEHKFTKEADFVRTRIMNINTILDGLEDVVSNRKKAIDVKFNWFD